MKFIKSFKLFENIIEPYNFEQQLTELKSLNKVTKEELVRIFEPINVEFVDIEYFKSKLETDKEIKLVPNTSSMFGGIKFAAFNYYTNKMYVCVNFGEFIRALNNRDKEHLLSLLSEILRHESIHKQQDEKRKAKGFTKRHLENSPKNPNKYFGTADETMAYAQTFIDECHKRGLTDEDILNQIKGDNDPISRLEDIYNKLSSDNLKRFKNYVYKYIKK